MAVGFINNVLDYVKTNHRITKKQMEAINKVHIRCSEALFKDTDNKIEKGQNVIICLSGRGDKDINTVEEYLRNNKI